MRLDQFSELLGVLKWCIDKSLHSMETVVLHEYIPPHTSRVKEVEEENANEEETTIDGRGELQTEGGGASSPGGGE